MLFFPAYFTIGWDVLWKAARNIAHGQVFDENFLMALATVGAFCTGFFGEGEYPEAVFVMLFYQVGELFQSYAVGKSRKSIASLMDIRPDYANVECDGQLVQVDPEQVAIGDVITVKAGEKVPLDGVVLEGSSSLNTAALTGESLPREVGAWGQRHQRLREPERPLAGAGDQGLRGVHRGEDPGPGGELQQQKGQGGELHHQICPVLHPNRGHRRRGPGGAAAPVLWPELGGLAPAGPDLPGGLLPLRPGDLRAPSASSGASAGASRQGILVKGGNYLEALAATEVVVFDKTGTLTQGVFHVTAIHPDQYSQAQLLELAALAESYSDHPISRSLKEAYGKELDTARVGEVEELSGHGVRARVDGKLVCAGNDKLMEEMGRGVAPLPPRGHHGARGGGRGSMPGISSSPTG